MVPEVRGAAGVVEWICSQLLGDDGACSPVTSRCVCVQVGELVGGSQREDRLDVLTRRIEGGLLVEWLVGCGVASVAVASCPFCQRVLTPQHSHFAP